MSTLGEQSEDTAGDKVVRDSREIIMAIIAIIPFRGMIRAHDTWGLVPGAGAGGRGRGRGGGRAAKGKLHMQA